MLFPSSSSFSSLASSLLSLHPPPTRFLSRPVQPSLYTLIGHTAGWTNIHLALCVYVLRRTLLALLYKAFTTRISSHFHLVSCVVVWWDTSPDLTLDLHNSHLPTTAGNRATLSINDYVWLLNYGRSWPCICVGRGDLQQKQHNPSSRDCGHHATCAGHSDGPFVLALTSLLVGDLVEAVLEHLVQMHRLIVFRHFKSHTRTHTLVHGHSKKYNFKRDSSRYPSHSIRIEHLPCCHYTSAIAEH